MDDLDDLDDDDEETPDLGDWRKFRASLIQQETAEEEDMMMDESVPCDTATPSSTTNNNNNSNPQQQASSSSATHKSSKTKPNNALNEALLAQQNQALADEYRQGVWAHVTTEPEVGGLLARLPLEAQLYYSATANDNQKTTSKTNTYWNKQLMQQLEKQQSSSSSNSSSSNSNTLARVDQWFQVAQEMITQNLQAINASPTITNGILNPHELPHEQRQLLNAFLNYKNSWQEINLILSHDLSTGCSETVVLNRPITKFLTQPLARIILEGANTNNNNNNDNNNNTNNNTPLMDALVQAFGQQAAVYMGGPHGQDQPATVVHGHDIPGAVQVAPGLYQGGDWHAIAEGVVSGTYDPLDFRFFLGKYDYHPQEYPERGALPQKVREHVYQPLACSRALALKQCLGLPKPLWHEGMCKVLLCSIL